jgi:GNAT superfamily N-acetyltransferase
MDPAPRLRLARSDDIPAIDDLMKRATREIFPRFYTDEQTQASVTFISAVDPMLVGDGTYYVVEVSGEIVGCGGWSRRDKLFTGAGESLHDARLLDPATEPARVRAMFVRPDWTRRGLGTMILEASEAAAKAEGFRSLALMSTMPGLPLYEKYGFRVDEPAEVTMPNGVKIAGASMSKRME